MSEWDDFRDTIVGSGHDHQPPRKPQPSPLQAVQAVIDEFTLAEDATIPVDMAKAHAAELERLRAVVAFLESKGILVGQLKSSDKPEPQLAYYIQPDSELDDTPYLRRLNQLEEQTKKDTALLAEMASLLDGVSETVEAKQFGPEEKYNREVWKPDWLARCRKALAEYKARWKKD